MCVACKLVPYCCCLSVVVVMIDMSSGSASGDSLLPGNGPCVRLLELTECCVGVNCGVGFLDDDCFCDKTCFGEGDCCPDVIAIGCQPGNADRLRVHAQQAYLFKSPELNEPTILE